MKDEIKEIIEGIEVVIKHNGTLEFDAKELKILLDYITNLQEEVKSANESITWWTNRFNALHKENKRLKEENRDLSRMCELYSKSLYNAELTDYKSRNEKALEINQKLQMMSILDSRATLWLFKQEKVLQGENKDVKNKRYSRIKKIKVFKILCRR